jgi:threonyl-tRNA synthetase
LQKSGIRVKIDLRNEKIGFKIREHTLKRIPYLVVVGDKEVENNELAVRSLSGKNMGNFTPEDFVTLLATNIAERNPLES